MKKILLSAIMAMMLIGCGSDDSKETIVPSDTIVTLDENQTIGYVPNTDVTIVNMGDGSYYINCPEGECPVNIGNTTTDDDTTNTDSHDISDSYNPTDSNDDNSPIAVIETPLVVENTTNNYTTPVE
jgi:hypothetical protein